MISIEYILGLLDCRKTEEEQKKGLSLARKVECISVFFCPKGKRYNKNIWENCAKIISERNDDKLLNYIYNMFLWISDPEAPGADIIFEVLASRKWFTFDFYYELFLNYYRCANNIKGEQTLLSLSDRKRDLKTEYVYHGLASGASDDIDEKNPETDAELLKSRDDTANLMKKGDKELEGKLYCLLSALKDHSLPGADIVYNRLLYGEWKTFEFVWDICMTEARRTGSKVWENNLQKLYEEKYQNGSPSLSRVRKLIQDGKKDDVVDIDYIMWLLSCKRDSELQKEGLKLACVIECTNAFIWPDIRYDVFSPWENCAKIISEKSDDELLSYFWELMKNLDNMMLPGAIEIYNRLLKCENIDEALDDYEKYVLPDGDVGHLEEVIEGLRLKRSFL